MKPNIILLVILVSLLAWTNEAAAQNKLPCRPSW